MELNIYIESFLAWPLVLRTACVLFVVVVLAGAVAGKYILRLLSFLPSLFRMVFHGIYFIIEWAIDRLHKAHGGSFHDIANALAQTAEKIDTWLLGWHESWRHAKGARFTWLFALYFVAVAYIGGVPMLTGSLDAPAAKGGKAYLQCEAWLMEWMEDKGLYMSPETIAQETVFMQLDNVYVLKNGKPVRLAVAMLMENGRPYIPVRSVMESALGGTVGWDSETGQVVVQRGRTAARISTGSPAAYVNGTEVELASAPVTIDTNMYVDAQEFLSLFDCHVSWFEEEGILAVSDTMRGELGALTLQWAGERLGR